MSHPLMLDYDRLRAALDAYSVVKAERDEAGKPFTQGDHERAMKAALDAADDVTSSVAQPSRLVALIDQAIADVQATAEPGWEFAPDDPPLKGLTQLRERVVAQQQSAAAEASTLVSAADVHVAVSALSRSGSQREALTRMVEMESKFDRGVVPLGRYSSGATASALYRRGLIAMRSAPRVGYVLTALGRVVHATLVELGDPESAAQETPQGTPVGALTINPLGAPLPGLTESQVREAGATAVRLPAKQQQALLRVLDAVGGPVGGDAGLTVPFNVVHHGTRRALVTFGMLRERVDRVQFTDFGLAAAKYLREQQS
jgi:hypothetical protein